MKKIPPKSNRKAITDAISGDSSISQIDKGMMIAKALSEDSKDKSKFSTFATLKNFIRGFKASDTHVVFGTDCLTPVSFILISTNDGADSIETMVDDTTNYLSYQLTQSKMYGIPLYNIGTPKGREALKAHINK
jgi:hypothetical protein